MRIFGAISIGLAVVYAILGALALAALIAGIDKDALAAVPAIVVALPWSMLLSAMEPAPDARISTAILAATLAINPLLLVWLGRRLRR